MVADAALDQICQSLTAAWPSTPAASVTLDGAAIRALFDPLFFPDPATGLEPFASARVCDNLVPLDYSVAWDSNGDHRLVVEYRGASRNEVCGMRVEVVGMYMAIRGPARGVVLFSGGDLFSKGGGKNPKIHLEVPPAESPATVRVVGAIEDPNVAGPDIDQVTGLAAGTIDDCISPDYVAAMKAQARATGRFFTSEASAEASPVDAEWAPQGGLSGLCVIELPAGQSVSMDLATTLNSGAEPGQFYLLCSGAGSVDLSIGGNGDYYGFVYVSGQISETAGTGAVHGAWFATGSVDMGKALDLTYNDDCVAFPNLIRTIGTIPIESTRVRLE